MDKAYDSILDTTIDATDLAYSSNPYLKESDRYLCLCCSEKVFLAAADSKIKSPHFRHKRGNNDKECEVYLGQPDSFEKYFIANTIKKSAFIFFNSERKTFEIGISFRCHDFANLKVNGSVLYLKTSYSVDAITPVSINDTFFLPNNFLYFTVNKYSTYYCLTIHPILSNINIPFINIKKLSFFKKRLIDSRAKLDSSNVVYTDTIYVVISKDKSYLNALISFSNIEIKMDLDEFETMNCRFFIAEILINEISSDFSKFLNRQGVQLQVRESVDILWPPVYIKNGNHISEKENVYIKASFKLLQNDNTTASIGYLCPNVFQANFLNSALIRKKNVDLMLQKISKTKSKIIYQVNEIPVESKSKLDVSDDMDYFIFDSYGCHKLIPDRTVYLSDNVRVVGYKNHHLNRIIISNNHKFRLSTAQIINDILKYHPQSEAYFPEEFIDKNFSNEIVAYLEKCLECHRINSVLKFYILKGLI